MINLAMRFARICHAGQKRKYTGEDYIEHPIAVMELLRKYAPEATEEMQCAALLHDVVEDTAATHDDIHHFFGGKVQLYVYYLTDKSRPSDGNRATRKKIDRDHIAEGPRQSQIIKLCDLIDNSRSIVDRDPDFAKVYMAEKRLVLDAIKMEHRLWHMADDIVREYERGVK